MIRAPLSSAVLACAAGWALALPSAAQERVSVALDWTPNTNHVGLYVAQAQGWYEEAGLEVELLPYADTAAGTLVASGVAQFGVVGSISLGAQRAAGADLVAVFAVVQHETGRLVVDASREDLQRPADLDGLTYAGFGSAWEQALISTIIRADGGVGEFETVTLGTSAYEALATVQVDFTLAVWTWEGVNAELEGRPERAFRYTDFGVPDQHTTLIGAQGAWLQANPQAARSFLAATERGYAFALQHPDEAAGILLDGTDGMLSNPELVHASMRELVEGDYLADDDGRVGRIDPARMGAIGTFLFENGVLLGSDGVVLTEKPDIAAWFTNAYLEP